MRGSFFGAAALAIALASWCSGPVSAADVIDGNGRLLTKPDTSRLLSVGSDTTEILYALGLGDKIVAVDTTSQYPAEALKKPQVGYMRALSTEGVLSVNPTLILAGADSGPAEVVRALKGSPVPFVSLPANEGPESLLEKIRLVGTVAGVEQKAGELAAKVSKGLETLAQDRKRVTKPARAIFIINVSGGRVQVAGKGTTADSMLRLAGLENAAASFNGYKPLSEEALVELAPDAIVTMSRSHGAELLDEIKKVQSVAATPAGKDGRIISMDAVYLLGFGPRAPDAARDLMAKVYSGVPQ